jgi:hypothetical protein
VEATEVARADQAEQEYPEAESRGVRRAAYVEISDAADQEVARSEMQ